MTWDLFFRVDDGPHIARVVVRLLVALLLGGLVGYNRQRQGKAAGLRTHMLVTVGSCLFVLAPLEAGTNLDQMMRVVQGLAAGIGFLGAGAIIKMPEERRIQGLTTAADIWVMAAVGMAVGLGYLWPAVLAIVLTAGVLWLVAWVEPRGEEGKREE
jgi:putative Mg2+ transporter-C (MgtC) family protein